MGREDVNVKCPFYERVTKLGIFCSGAKHIRNVHIQFDSEVYKNSHKIEHCENMYHSCAWYRFLNAYYENNSR